MYYTIISNYTIYTIQVKTNACLQLYNILLFLVLNKSVRRYVHQLETNQDPALVLYRLMPGDAMDSSQDGQVWMGEYVKRLSMEVVEEIATILCTYLKRWKGKFPLSRWSWGQFGLKDSDCKSSTVLRSSGSRGYDHSICRAELVSLPSPTESPPV